MVCKMLCDLARQEGFHLMINIKFENKDVEKLTPDWVRTNIKLEGIFEGTYECPPDKEKEEFRESLG